MSRTQSTPSRLLLDASSLHGGPLTSGGSASGSPFGPIGATLLAQGLKGNRSLTHLDVSWNRMGDEGLSALADGVKVWLLGGSR